MLLTLVVSDRSKMDTILFAISVGTRPVSVQTTLTTGMLMAGKISTGVRSSATGAIRRRRSEKTTKV
jgi:hypothetical protein